MFVILVNLLQILISYMEDFVQIPRWEIDFQVEPGGQEVHEIPQQSRIPYTWFWGGVQCDEPLGSICRILLNFSTGKKSVAFASTLYM